MSGMIERVAMAIASTDGESFQVVARAAIEAMREPTDAMTKKSVDFALGVSLSSDYRWPDYMADLHRLNIDAALAEHATT